MWNPFSLRRSSKRSQRSSRDEAPAQPSPETDPTGSIDRSRREFEYLFRLFELYTNVQVDADTIYHNRTSIITLAEGLLLIAYQGLLQKGLPAAGILGLGIAVIGLVLSALWLFFEQRNAAYFTGRGVVLENLEEELGQRASRAEAEFAPFWTAVPTWVKDNAKIYQRVSAPLILRVFVPGMFAVSWLLILLFTSTIFVGLEEPQPSVPVEVVVRHVDDRTPGEARQLEQDDRSDSTGTHQDQVVDRHGLEENTDRN